VFVDIESETFNVDPRDLECKVSPRSRAIMVVDVFGHPVQWDEILRIAQSNDLSIIDDSCEALCAEYKGRKIGTLGRAAAFAFHPNKQITTGEGGVIVTDDGELSALTRSLQNQGRKEMGSWLDHAYLGYNYRLDEMSAALGTSQLGRIDEILAKCERVAKLYSDRLKDVDMVRVPIVKSDVRMSWFVYVVTLAERTDRQRLIENLSAAGIPSRAYFSPIHLQPYLQNHALAKNVDLPVTEAVAPRTLALPFHNNLTEA
jgi:perosamine synthetase